MYTSDSEAFLNEPAENNRFKYIFQQAKQRAQTKEYKIASGVFFLLWIVATTISFLTSDSSAVWIAIQSIFMLPFMLAVPFIFALFIPDKESTAKMYKDYSRDHMIVKDTSNSFPFPEGIPILENGNPKLIQRLDGQIFPGIQGSTPAIQGTIIFFQNVLMKK